MNDGKLRVWGVVAVIAALTTAVAPTLAAQARILGARSELLRNNGRVIVTMKRPGSGAQMMAPGTPPVSAAELDQISSRLETARVLTQPRELSAIGAVSARTTESGIAELLNDPNVAMIEPDIAFVLQEEPATGPLREHLAGLDSGTAQSVPWGVSRVQAEQAWDVVGQGSGVKVGIMDSGGDIDHPDLAWAGGYNPMKGSTSPSDWDDTDTICKGHGTHVAGTVAARDNGIGVVGVAPAASLYALKVFENVGGQCVAYASSQIAALLWAADHGIRVVNASIGGGASGSYMMTVSQVAAKGTYLVAAAGNSGGAMLYPAAYAEAIAVANLDQSNNRVSSSSYGTNMAVGAPGQGINSTMPGGGYGSKSGTSMASPHVTGVVALLIAQNPGIDLAGIRAKLQAGSLDVGASGWDDRTGWGLIQAYNMVSGGKPAPAPAEPLTVSVTPGSRRAAAVAGGSAPADNASVTLAGDNAATASWSASKRKSWITLTTSSGIGNGTVAWSRNTAGLAPGVYVDTITVSVAGSSASDRIIDSLTITAAPVPLALAVTPASRSATAQVGASAPKGEGSVTLSGDGASTAKWTATKRKSWTTLTTSSGTGSGTVAWGRNTAGLAPGVYVDTITVSVAGTSASDRIIDSLTITAAPVPLALVVTPASRSATAQVGTSAPKGEGSVTLSGDGASTAKWTATKRKSWITLTTSSGTGSGTVSWSGSTAGLAPGVYVDTITVSVAGTSASDRIIDSLTITAAPVPLALAVTPASRSAAAQVGASAPKGEGSVTLSGDGASSARWSAVSNKSWITLTTGSGTGSGTVSWSRSTAGLTPGVYVDTITVSVAGTGASAQIIDSLTITRVPVPLTLAVTPGSRSVTVQAGDAAPSGTGSVALSGDGAATAVWTATRRSNWTTLTSASGTGNGTVSWSRSTAGLTPGVYVDTITVSVAGSSAADRIIDTLTVTRVPVPLVATAAPSSRHATVQAGAAAPADSVAVLLSGDGATTTSWVASSTAGWSSLTRSSGVGTGMVRWNRSASGLAVGTHVNTISIAVAGRILTVLDSLTVTAAPVPLAVQVTPAGRRATGVVGGAASLDSVEVRLSGDGAATASWSATAGASSTTLTAASGVGSGMLRWRRNLAGLGVGLHVDTLRVTVPGAIGSPFLVIDSLELRAAPVPLTLALTPGSRRVRVEQNGDGGTGAAAIQLAGDAAGSTLWTASNRRTWNQLTMTSGVGGATLNWRRNTAALPAGMHVDTIMISAADLVARLIDSVEIVAPTAAPRPEAPVAAIALARRGGRHREARMTGQQIPMASDSVQVQALTGVASANWTAQEQSTWLSVTTQAGQAPGWLRWTRNANSLPLGLSVDSIIVTASADPSLRAVYVDTVEVVSVSAPAPGLAVRELIRGAGNLNVDQRTALDNGGNRNGRFDLGDFLAWVRRSNIRLSASEMSTVQQVIRQEAELQATPRARTPQNDRKGDGR